MLLKKALLTYALLLGATDANKVKEKLKQQIHSKNTVKLCQSDIKQPEPVPGAEPVPVAETMPVAAPAQECTCQSGGGGGG